jgi:hypothetical protein
MLCLTGLTDRILLVPASAALLSWHISYMDYSPAGQLLGPGREGGDTRMQGPTRLLAGPSTGRRTVESLVVKNRMATTLRVVIVYQQGAANIELCQQTLASGAILQYGPGFSTLGP